MTMSASIPAKFSIKSPRAVLATHISPCSCTVVPTGKESKLAGAHINGRKWWQPPSRSFPRAPVCAAGPRRLVISNQPPWWRRDGLVWDRPRHALLHGRPAACKPIAAAGGSCRCRAPSPAAAAARGHWRDLGGPRDIHSKTELILSPFFNPDLG
jgi:hypothetical protein